MTAWEELCLLEPELTAPLPFDALPPTREEHAIAAVEREVERESFAAYWRYEVERKIAPVTPRR